jgi:hypothetical protein
MSNPKHYNIFFTFYITSIIFYYYSNKKNPLQNKTFSLFYKIILNFLIFYITSITSYYYLNKKFATQPFTQHIHYITHKTPFTTLETLSSLSFFFKKKKKKKCLRRLRLSAMKKSCTILRYKNS